MNNEVNVNTSAVFLHCRNQNESLQGSNIVTVADLYIFIYVHISSDKISTIKIQ